MLQFKHNPRGPYGEGFSAAHAGYLYSYWLDEDETGTFYQADIYSREDRDDDDHLLEDQQFNKIGRAHV